MNKHFILPTVIDTAPQQSWPLRRWSLQAWSLRLGTTAWQTIVAIYGTACFVLLLAIVASVPVVQVLSLGYLLAISGHLARGGSWQKLMAGSESAVRCVSLLIGIAITTIPFLVSSRFWTDARLIAPTSDQTQELMVITVLTGFFMAAHVVTALIAGGRLRHFAWPLTAPVALTIWLLRQSSWGRRLIEFSLTSRWPKLSHKLQSPRPLADWFVPAMVWQQLGRADAVRQWSSRGIAFLGRLNWPATFARGAVVFLASSVWLFLPTSLLIASIAFEQPVPNFIVFLSAISMAVPIFFIVNFMQVHYARSGNIATFWRPGLVMRSFGRAPLAHAAAFAITLLLAAPLFVLKIEQIDPGFWWLLNLLFIGLALPGRVLGGWAVRRGINRPDRSAWWIRWPALALIGALSLAFVIVLFTSRYTSWDGSWSLLKNHVFLLPTPF